MLHIVEIHRMTSEQPEFNLEKRDKNLLCPPKTKRHFDMKSKNARKSNKKRR